MKLLITQIISYTVVQLFMPEYQCYNLRCPVARERIFRSIALCGSAKKNMYFCFYNTIEETYVEGCNHTHPKKAQKGSRLIIAGKISRGICPENFYQPILFSKEMSDCIYLKTRCVEEGQIIYNRGDNVADTLCTCENRDGFYLLVMTTKNSSYCHPYLYEDCSWFRKRNMEGKDAGYSKPKALILKREPTTYMEEQVVLIEVQNKILGHIHDVRRVEGLVFVVVIFLKIFFVWIVFNKTLTENSLREILLGKQSRKVQREGEANFLQLLSFLYHVATPLVRITFDRNIPEFKHKMADLRFNQTIEKNIKIEKFQSTKINSDSSKDLDLLLMVEVLKTDKVSQQELKVFESVGQLFISMKEHSTCFLIYSDYQSKGIKISKDLHTVIQTEAKEHFLFYTIISDAGVDQTSIWLQCLKKRVHLSNEKNNFLKIVYMLYKVVRPAVEHVYEEMKKPWKHMTSREIKQRMYENFFKTGANDRHLTETEFNHLQKKVDSSSSDLSLKLLIYIVKSRKFPKGMAPIDHPELKALISLDRIRIEITYSPNGMLTKDRFSVIWNNIEENLKDLPVQHHLQDFEWLKDNDNILETLRSD